MERAKRDIDISLRNIERLSGQSSSLEIRTKAHIREMARGALRFLPKELSFEEGEDFRRNYSIFCENLSPALRVEFCRFLVADGAFAKNELSGKLLDVQKSPQEATIVYVKNALSDIAFECFSKSFDRAQVCYASDFESALEDVYYSKADYAILPIASSMGGRMLRFSELMLRYEMKIVLSCDVHSNMDDSENTFILLSKNTEFLFSENEEQVFFEFVLSRPEDTLIPILEAAQAYGCKYSFSHSFSENDAVMVGLEISGGDPDAFCLYLFLEAPRHLPIGVYPSRSN